MNCKNRGRLSFGFLIPPHPLTNFEIIKYYENESRFNGVCSRDNLPSKMKDGAFVINLAEHSDIGTHLVALYVKNNDPLGCFVCKK